MRINVHIHPALLFIVAQNFHELVQCVLKVQDGQ